MSKKDKQPTSSHFKPSAKKAMANRSERAQVKRELAHAAETNGSQYGTTDDQTEERVQRVAGLLRDAGVEFADSQEVKFVDPEAINGVTMSLRKLVYNPGSAQEDLTLPWYGSHADPQSIQRFLKTLSWPKWALEMKDSYKSLSRPNTEGMIRSDGSFNKDLEQLLTPAQPLDYTREMLAMEHDILGDLARRVVVSNYDRPLVDVVETTAGPRVRLRHWTFEEFKVQMSKAFNTSSPGYPYNGFSWQDEVDSESCEHLAWRLGQAFVADTESPPFLFIQQSRTTGDGSTDGGENAEDGRQRLVQAAPIVEKYIGHLLAYVFKAFIKAPLLSGQKGIQEVSRQLKHLAQSPICTDKISETYVAYWDVSRWDTAQTDEAMERGFFSVARLVLDLDDPFTRDLFNKYYAAYGGRTLLTAMGQLRSKFLPSGSSITTVSAFINHEKQLLLMDRLSVALRGEKLFIEIGLQSDDLVAFVRNWDDKAEAIVKDVYDRHGCLIKGEALVKPLSDPQCMCVFLNEGIRLSDDPEVDNNAKGPKWSLFYAESQRQKIRGANIDRMLLEEVNRKVAHPSPTELTFVSFCSKMDRFANMPFYTSLLKQILGRTQIPLHSWLGERVCPESPTLKRLREWEEADDVFWPSEAQRALDRRQETWMLGTELGEALSVLWLVSTVSTDARSVCKDIVRLGKQTKAWARARKAMAVAGVDFTKNNTLREDDIATVTSVAFNVGYRDIAEAINQAKIVTETVANMGGLDAADEISDEPSEEPVLEARSFVRGGLALHERDPYELRYLAALATITTRHSSGWDAMTEDQQTRVVQWYKDQYGEDLNQTKSVKNRKSSLDKDWLT